MTLPRSKEGPNESLRAVRCVCSGIPWRACPKSLSKAAGLIAVALAVGSAHLVAQQPYAYAAQQPPAYYNGQYASPGQPYGAPQSQYGDPQYPQLQYGQPQYAPQPPYAQQSPDQQAYPEQPASPQPAYAGNDQMQPEQGDQQAQPALSADDLEQLVAPIALYPDALLAQILTASTYPAQVSVASQWLLQMKAQGYGSPDMIASGADAQSDWDPSIKALTAFPQILVMMDQNLEWTTTLGNAFFNQPQDVMQTVQVLRERAAAAGTLQSTPQESVSNDQGDIELAPTNPEEVSVPVYNPGMHTNQPVSPLSRILFCRRAGLLFGRFFGRFSHQLRSPVSR